MSNRILIAKITTAHGIKGLVKLKYFGENIEDVEKYNPFYMSSAGHDTVKLQIKNAIKGGFVAEVDGIKDRNQAEDLRNTELFIEEDKITPPAEDEFLQKDLIGCEVFENTKKLGKIIAIDNFGAGDLLDIKPSSGQSFYLPFQDEFIKDILLEDQKIYVSLPEGLID